MGGLSGCPVQVWFSKDVGKMLSQPQASNLNPSLDAVLSQ